MKSRSIRRFGHGEEPHEGCLTENPIDFLETELVDERQLFRVEKAKYGVER